MLVGAATGQNSASFTGSTAASESSAPPPSLKVIIQQIFGSEAEDWLKAVSHRYAGVREQPLDLIVSDRDKNEWPSG